MDGIPVKISEKYKPPKKIVLPGSLQNKLNAGLKFEEYDFELEKSVVEKMSRLKELRKKTAEKKERKIDLEDLQDSTKNLSFSPSLVSQNPILTPVPITAKTDQKKEVPIGPINFSDFESDTSSPFDNMELKTINELEELAHVLGTNQPEKVNKYVQPQNGYNHNNSIPWNGPYYTGNWVNQAMPLQSYVVQRVHSPPMAVSPPQSSYMSSRQQISKEKLTANVPNILQELQMHLHERKASELAKQTSAPSTSQPMPSLKAKSTSANHIKSTSENKISSLTNPFSQLTLSCQNLAQKVAEMGFPVARVSRIAQKCGNDEAKVIEVLLQVQKLEDLKIPPDRAEKALIANNFDEESTLRYLDNMNQLLGLGFEEDKVAEALSTSKNNRDKALDFLIS